MNSRHVFLVALMLWLTADSHAQTDPDAIDSVPPSAAKVLTKYIDKAGSKAGRLEEKLDKKSAQALREMQQLEAKMQKKLARLDSIKGKEIFGNAKKQYQRFEEKLQKKGSLQQYIPSLDSLSTSLKFLQQNEALLSTVKGSQQKIKAALTKVRGIEDQLQKAEDIKTFLRERRQYLKEQLAKLGFSRELKKLNKKVYYYNQQVAEYKDILNDQQKIERKALELLSRTHFFRDFMQKNGMMAGLFPTQNVSISTSPVQSGFAGLQTRAQVTAFIQQSVLRTASAMPRVQQNIQNAQSQVTDLRNKIYELTGRDGADLELPDFKPNSQKTKSFLKRLEYGINLQSQRATNFFPVTSDLGLSVGYRLTDKNIIGIGVSYKIGWGKSWKNINLSNEGAGLRSFIDWKVKKGFGISGGYEQNYRTQFNSIDQLKNKSAWQQSGLIGMFKTVSVKSKLFKKTKIQLLWDFMSYQQVPTTQPVVFRLGYNF